MSEDPFQPAESEPLAEPVAPAVAVEPVEAGATVSVLPVLAPPGGRLRAAREAQGQGIGQVVEALRVEQRLVEAMESNHFEVFDAPVYARGFLRKYATYLGLPAEDLMSDLAAISRGPATPTLVPMTTAAPRQRDWSRLTTGAGIVLAIVLVLGSFWWWRVRAVPAAAPVAANQTPSKALPPQPLPTAQSAPQPAPDTAPSDVATVDPSAAADAGAATNVQPSSPTSTASAHGTLEFDFRGDSWVEVTNADGSRAMYGLVRAGEHRSFHGTGPWRILLGKADLVRVTLDGRDIVAAAEQRKGETASYRLDADGRLF